MADLVVHHLETSRSHRVTWLLEELEQPYELVVHKRTRGRRAPDSLRQVHPLGRSPVVVLDGQVIAESGAILETLLDRFDPDQVLRPSADDPRLVDWRFWLHYAEGSLMPPLLMKMLTTLLRRAVPFPIHLPLVPGAMALERAYILGEVANHLSFCDAHLASHRFVLGEAFSAADIQMAFPLEGAMKDRAHRAAYPAIARYVQEMAERPAYQRAVSKGGRPF